MFVSNNRGLTFIVMNYTAQKSLSLLIEMKEVSRMEGKIKISETHLPFFFKMANYDFKYTVCTD